MSKLQLKPEILTYSFATVHNYPNRINTELMRFDTTINSIPAKVITRRSYMSKEEMVLREKEVNPLEILESKNPHRPFMLMSVEGIDIKTLKTVADVDFRELLQIHNDKYYEYVEETTRKEREERARLYDNSSVHTFKIAIGFGEVIDKNMFVNEQTGSTVTWEYELKYKGKYETFKVTDNVINPSNVRVLNCDISWGRGREMRIEKAVTDILTQIEAHKYKIDRIIESKDFNTVTYDLLVSAFPNAIVEKNLYSEYAEFSIYIKEKDEQLPNKKGIKIRRNHGGQYNGFFVVTEIIGKFSLEGIKNLFETVTNISEFNY
jgi:hypothetical protein